MSNSNLEKTTKGTPSSWSTVEITQNCSYGWTPESVEKFLKDWSCVKDYAFIFHDKDRKADSDDLVDPHVHLMIRFNSPTPTAAIISRAKKVGLPDACITENRLEKMKSWGGALNYLTHRDVLNDNKYKYEVDDVISNFDWLKDADLAHNKKTYARNVKRAFEIVEMIENGVITMANVHELLKAWEEVIYHKEITLAFKRNVAKEKLKGSRNMKVTFISGDSGVGKDTLAVDYCEKNGYTYYRTSNNDQYPFDDYKGQDVIIWADARDNVFTPQQLFALLDNYWKSSQKARYSDVDLNCKEMIITSIKPLNEWYADAFDKAGEDHKQLFRRISLWYKLDPEYVSIFYYNQRDNTYHDTGAKLINGYTHSADYLDTPEKGLDYAIRSIGALKDSLVNVQNNLSDINPDLFSNVKDLPVEEKIKGENKNA